MDLDHHTSSFSHFHKSSVWFIPSPLKITLIIAFEWSTFRHLCQFEQQRWRRQPPLCAAHAERFDTAYNVEDQIVLRRRVSND